ncbi:MAG: hypothetical protein WBA46_01235 [Thermomicrobiales bacterium]
MGLVTKGLKATVIPFPAPPVVDHVAPDVLLDRIINESHDAFFAWSSMRRLVRKQEKLLPKLADETLVNDPSFGRATFVSIDLDHQMSTLLATIASSESDAQRCWDRLTPMERGEGAHWWRADPEQDSLIGHTFVAWPECEIAPDFPAVHLPRILRNVKDWPPFAEWQRKGVYRP